MIGQLLLFKTCLDCKQIKVATRTHFYKSSSKPDGHNIYCIPCQKVRAKKNYTNSKEYHQNYRSEHKVRRNKCYKRLWTESKTRRLQYYKTQAKKRGITFRLVLEDIEDFWGQPCHYCNLQREDLVGIDRIDSAGPYHRKNIVPCCHECNKAKGVKSYEDFYDVDKE